MKRTLSLLTFICLAFSFAMAQTHNGHAYIDLGLPSGTKWATCNVGASRSTDYGKLFNWEKSKVAANNWGGMWRVPSKEDWNELYDNCSFELLSNGACLVVGPNGNNIILPAAGSKFKDELAEDVGVFGIYWSSSLKKYDSTLVWCFHFGNPDDAYPLEDPDMGWTDNRFESFSVRLVCSPKK